MKNLRKKLVVSMIAIMCALVCLGTSTFAWFSLMKTAEVKAFSASIVSEGVLQISIDNGTTWADEIGEADIQALIDEAFDEASFKPVTTADGKTFYDMNGEAAEKGVDYLQFSFKVRTSTAKQNIYLVAKDSKITGDASTWKADKTVGYAKGALTKGEDVVLLQANAIRIKFDMVWGEGESDKKSVVVANGAELTAEGAGYASYASAEDGLAALYAEAKHMNLPDNLPAPMNDVIYLHGRENTVDQETGKYLGNVLLGHTADSLSAEAVVIDAGKTAKVAEATFTVTVWLEGWDDNCLNGIQGANFAYGFILSTEADDDVAPTQQNNG